MSNDPSKPILLNRDIYELKAQYFRELVGTIVSRWANAEFQMLRLANEALGLGSMEVTVRIFSYIPSPDKQFKLLNDLVKTKPKLNEVDLAEWASLRAECDRLRILRNHFAHSGIVGHGAGPFDSIDWADVEPRSGPSFQDHLLGKKQVHKGTSDAEKAVDDIQKFIERLFAFTERLASIATSR